MLNARRNFLNSGFYEPIANSVTSKIQTLTAKQKAPVIIDVGCGEGYYTRKIADNIVGSHCVGADISKMPQEWRVLVARILNIVLRQPHICLLNLKV